MDANRICSGIHEVRVGPAIYTSMVSFSQGGAKVKCKRLCVFVCVRVCVYVLGGGMYSMRIPTA